jgi:hypothetical protein
MKPVILVILLFGGCFYSYAQQILSVDINLSNDKRPLTGSMNFIIDPVDSAVLAYGHTDKDGNCSFNLSRPLRSEKFLVKVFAMGYSSSSMLIERWVPGRKYYFDWNYEHKETHVLNIYMNKNGILLGHHNPIFDSIPFIYYKHFCDTNSHYYEMTSKAYEIFQNEMALYNREMVRIDSLQKIYDQLAYAYPKMPDPPEWLVSEKFPLMVSKFGGIEDGWYPFFDTLRSNYLFRLELRKNKRIRVHFRFSSEDQIFEDLVICNKKDLRIKGLTSLCKRIVEKKLGWEPMSFNGKSVKLNNKAWFYIDVIYR